MAAVWAPPTTADQSDHSPQETMTRQKAAPRPRADRHPDRPGNRRLRRRRGQLRRLVHQQGQRRVPTAQSQIDALGQPASQLVGRRDSVLQEGAADRPDRGQCAQGDQPAQRQEGRLPGGARKPGQDPSSSYSRPSRRATPATPPSTTSCSARSPRSARRATPSQPRSACPTACPRTPAARAAPAPRPPRPSAGVQGPAGARGPGRIAIPCNGTPARNTQAHPRY